MRRFKKQIKTPLEKNKEVSTASKYLDKINGKQIIGYCTIKPAGGDAVTTLYIEDGTEIYEDEAGKKLTNGEVKYVRRKKDEKNINL